MTPWYIVASSSGESVLVGGVSEPGQNLMLRLSYLFPLMAYIVPSHTGPYKYHYKNPTTADQSFSFVLFTIQSKNPKQQGKGSKIHLAKQQKITLLGKQAFLCSLEVVSLPSAEALTIKDHCTLLYSTNQLCHSVARGPFQTSGLFRQKVKLQRNPNFFLLRLIETCSLKGKPLYIRFLFPNGSWRRLYTWTVLVSLIGLLCSVALTTPSGASAFCGRGCSHGASASLQRQLC